MDAIHLMRSFTGRDLIINAAFAAAMERERRTEQAAGFALRFQITRRHRLA